MRQPFLSIIVPVHNGGSAFATCLHAIATSRFRDWELIVVDDASTDASRAIAQEFGATVLRNTERKGPAAARNLGAIIARGKYLCFLDADCEVHPVTLNHLVAVLRSNPHLDAVFGSYDDAPRAKNFVSQYKNLFHHYIHQMGQENASTFWTGCGAIKRSTFLKLDGFNARRYPRPSIEDIELGYRIRREGGTIHLAKQVQVKHHKSWNCASLLKTDICDRAIPWTQLIWGSSSGVANDLNLRISSRISVLLIYLLLVTSLLSFVSAKAATIAVFCMLSLLFINFKVYHFFYQKRGKKFALISIPMHWFYYFYSGLSFGLGSFLYCRNKLDRNCNVAAAPVQFKRQKKSLVK